MHDFSQTIWNEKPCINFLKFFKLKIMWLPCILSGPSLVNFTFFVTLPDLPWHTLCPSAANLTYVCMPFLRGLLNVMNANQNLHRRHFQVAQSEILLQNQSTVLSGQNIFLSKSWLNYYSLNVKTMQTEWF